MSIDYIRGVKFPESVRLALREIEKCLSQDQGARIPGLGGHEDGLAERIADEHIFMLRPGRPYPIKRFTAVQELHLQEHLIEFFSSGGDSKLKTKAFLALFNNKSSSFDHKVGLLCKLVSMAIALKTKTVLDCAGAWMKDQRYGTPECVKLAEHVIHDYCLLVPGATTSLQELPKISPPFTCNFITALTHVYRSKGAKVPANPPYSLLEVITEWVSHDPVLLLHSALRNPGNAIETPIPGLVSWCIYAPILLLQNTQKPKIEGEELRRIQQLYSKLFLGLLNTLLSTKSLMNPARELLPCVVISNIVETLLVLMSGLSDKSEQDCVQIAMERLGQVLQVALVTKTTFADKGSLKILCSKLPECRLLQIVLQ